ncbi:hypothetical protein AHAS_Ahas02G0037600 [Arachis hypogaea]
MGQEFSHEGVNSEHTSYDQYEQEEEKHEEIDVDYMDEDDTNVEPMFDYHGFDEGLNQTARDVAYVQWPSAAMMNAHSYDQFRHAVFQASFGQQPLSFDYSQNY